MTSKTIIISTIIMTLCGCASTMQSSPSITTEWTGIGIVTGLNGKGDGADYSPLVLALKASADLRGIDPTDAAVVIVAAANPSSDGKVTAKVFTIVPCQDLSNGFLVDTPLVRMPGIDYGHKMMIRGNLEADPDNALSVALLKSIVESN